MAKTKCVFHGTVKILGVNPHISVSKSLAATLKPEWHKPLPVLVRLDGKPAAPHRINLMPVGDGTFYLYLNGIVRKTADVSVGDSVRAELQFDASYRNGPQHPMPRWFRDALKENRGARSNWITLPPSRQKEVLRYLARLKSAEARARNLARALRVLSGSRGRFMGRGWKNGH